MPFSPPSRTWSLVIWERSAKEYGDTRVGEDRNTVEGVAPVVRFFGRLAAEAFGVSALHKVYQTMIDGTYRLPAKTS